MSGSAVAFVPSAPLLIPAIAGRSAGLDEELRGAALAAVDRVIGSGPERVVVVAAGPASGEWDGGSTWGFQGFGVARRPADPRPVLPWQLGIGAWLLDQCGWAGDRIYLAVTDDAELRSQPDRVDVIAVGDGSACRSEKAPGHLDDRAAAFDATIAGCLARGDVAALATVDRQLAADLLCDSAPMWRWVSAAVGDRHVAADLLADSAPYGVGYFVAAWSIS